MKLCRFFKIIYCFIYFFVCCRNLVYLCFILFLFDIFELFLCIDGYVFIVFHVVGYSLEFSCYAKSCGFERVTAMPGRSDIVIRRQVF